MRSSYAVPALLLALGPLTALAACSDDGGGDTASDPGGTSSAAPAASAPTSAPLPAGPVRTVTLATVLDDGDGAQLCLGPVAESYPPQCGGDPLPNWDWARHGQGMFERQGAVRWGTFAVTGTYDGTAFTVTEAVPGPLYDPAVLEPTPTPTPATAYDEARLEAIAAEVRGLPGARGSYSDGTVVTLEVLYDDGSLQRWTDEEYGAGVVRVSPQLVDA